MRQTLQHVGLIVAVGIVVLFTNLGAARLWDRDEPRNAGCAAEMLARNDWVVPWFNDELRAHKPVLLYWLIMSAYSVLGVNEFSARFWSAALGIGSALCTYCMGRRLFNPEVGVWAAAILTTCLMFDIAARAATPDSTLVFLVAATMTAFVCGVYPRRAAKPVEPAPACDAPFLPVRISLRTGVILYALMGAAVLAKGPVGFVLPTAILGMFLLVVRLPADATRGTQHRNRIWGAIHWLRQVFAPAHFLRTFWALRPVTAAMVVLLVAAPWYAWVGWRTDGEFLRGFFLDHNLARAMQSREGHAGSSLFFYPIAMLIGFFPWSVFAAPTILETVRRLASRDHASGNAPGVSGADPLTGHVFALCWTVVWVTAFSLAQTKLPSYVTPCYPALALLTGSFLVHWSRGTSRVGALWPRLALASLATVGLVMLVALPLVTRRYLPGDEGLAALGLIPLLGAGVAGWFCIREQRSAARLTCAVTATLLTTCLFGFGTQRVDRHQQNHLLLQAIDLRSDQPEVGAYGCLEPSWVFYGGRPVRELSLGESLPVAASPMAPKSRPDAVEFLKAGPQRFVITTDRQFQDLQPLLPDDVEVITQIPLFLKKDRLVLLGHKNQPVLSRDQRPPSRTR